MVFDKLRRIAIVNPNRHDEGGILNYIQNDIPNKFQSGVWAPSQLAETFFEIGLSFSLGVTYFGGSFIVLIGASSVLSFFVAQVFKRWFAAEDKWS